MLFNSFPFLFIFLPVAYLGAFFLFRSGKGTLAVYYVALCSLFFYGYWNPVHIWVIIGSILVNYAIGGWISGETVAWRRKSLLTLGVAFNLGLLGYFKYLGFFSGMLDATRVDEFFNTIVNVALPIGISFYTFQQIAYQVDCYASPKHSRYTFAEYTFFVTFFPQLIAGPIVHHREIMPQLSRLGRRLRGSGYVACYFTPGLALLLIGLAKKVLIADTFGSFADQPFSPMHIDNLTFLDAWGGVSAYTLQIYFDFSGYSDMAIGLGLLFGLRLPVNFLAPYKAGSIIEFWRRWHMTLSRFLRDYLYVPLGGSRHGKGRRYVNLLATMVIGGLWHGANWTFVLWGLIHGLLLAANHGLRHLCSWRPPAWLAVPVTFVFVMLSWVPFRAESFSDMLSFYQVMAGSDGIVVPWGYQDLVSGLGPLAEALSIRAGDVRLFGGMRQILVTVAGLLIVFFGPNSMTLVDVAGRRRVMRSVAVPLGLGCATTLVLLIMWAQTEVTFLYFQF